MTFTVKAFIKVTFMLLGTNTGLLFSMDSLTVPKTRQLNSSLREKLNH